jgi:hypothetical protein
MRFRITAILALLAYSSTLGCSSLRDVPISEVQPAERFAAIICRTGEVVEFNEHGGIVNSYKGTIDGTDRHGATVSIPLSQVTGVRAERTNMVKTVVWMVVITGVVVGTWAIIIHNVNSTGLML